MADPIRVTVRECPDGTHNGEGDWVALAPTLSLEGGLVAEADLRAVRNIPDETERGEALNRRWVLTFVRYGAKDWNFHTEEGPLPFDIEAILADYSLARLVAERANDLYAESVMRPFLTRQPKRSPTGPTAATTSPRPRRTGSRSKPSSPDTSADMPPSGT